MSPNGLPRERLEEIRRFDTCTLSNAIERLKVRPHNEGFVYGGPTCCFPELPPVIGYAVTGRIRTSMPPIQGRWYHENVDFLRYVESVPSPRFVVLQDCDPAVGLGALFGEIHARICGALGCTAYLTNGAVRDLPSVRNLGFQLFAGSFSVSHAYAHVIDFGGAVEIGGLRISSGDLLHGDLHGVQSIPLEAADRLPEMAREVTREEEELFRLFAQKDFSVDQLESNLRSKMGRNLRD